MKYLISILESFLSDCLLPVAEAKLNAVTTAVVRVTLPSKSLPKRLISSLTSSRKPEFAQAFLLGKIIWIFSRYDYIIFLNIGITDIRAFEPKNNNAGAERFLHNRRPQNISSTEAL